MSPKISLLLATGLLAATTFRLPHPSVPPADRSDGKPPGRAGHRSEAAAWPSESNLGSPVGESEPIVSTEPVTGRSTGRIAGEPNLTATPAQNASQPTRKRLEKPAPDEHASPAAAPVERTIQLSENFRLPAAMMGRSLMKPGEKPAAVEAVTRQIGDTFYQKLGTIVAKPRETASVKSDAEADVVIETNVVVEPDEESGQVLDHADQLYRSMFGQEAFNRMTLSSAVEVRLPATDTAVSE